MTPDAGAALGVLQVRARLALGSFRLDVAFAAAPGETLALVGPSGAGKSTCLAAVAGLRGLEAGRVSVGDAVWCDTALGLDLPPHARRVGLVQQEYALFPHRDVLGNVRYGARARGAGREEATREALRWIERLGIGAYARSPVTALSGGQRQRVALARALVAGAQVLLLDEPFGALDAATRHTVRRELAAFLHEVRLPAVVVTHDPADALTVADRIAILEDGQITQVGEGPELLSRPRTPFVATLFGVNFHRAELGPGDGLREAALGEAVFHVVTDVAPGPVALAFPPSAVTLSPGRPAGSARNTFPGRVMETVRLPDRTRVVVDCGIPLAADVVREAAVSLHLAPGQAVWASVKATAIQVYR